MRNHPYDQEPCWFWYDGGNSMIYHHSRQMRKSRRSTKCHGGRQGTGKEFHFKRELEVDQSIIDNALKAYYQQFPAEDWLK